MGNSRFVCNAICLFGSTENATVSVVIVAGL